MPQTSCQNPDWTTKQSRMKYTMGKKMCGGWGGRQSDAVSETGDEGFGEEG